MSKTETLVDTWYGDFLGTIIVYSFIFSRTCSSRGTSRTLVRPNSPFDINSNEKGNHS